MEGAASHIFLQTALEEVATAGYKIVNVDTVLVLAQPKIVPIAGEMRERVAELLGVKPGGGWHQGEDAGGTESGSRCSGPCDGFAGERETLRGPSEIDRHGRCR